MPEQVLRDDARNRYELIVDGSRRRHRRLRDRGLGDGAPTHRDRSRSAESQGLGAVLVKGVLDDARARGIGVVPTCWYVREYIEQHPEEADLVAS